MELFDEELNLNNKKGDSRKTTTAILIAIILLIAIVVGLVSAIFIIQQSTLSVELNGQSNRSIKNMLKIENEGTNKEKVYVPIRAIASYLGYDSYNGNYNTVSEDPHECYVECADEIAMFKLNSNIIYKTDQEGKQYDYFKIDNPVKSIEDELYITIDGIEQGFNVSWNYDKEKKKMEIYTMPALIQMYSGLASSRGYKVSEDFTNQKAILKGMLIIENDEEGSNNKKSAVINTNNNTILEPKYENIEYLEHTTDFLVTAKSKKGIISSSKQQIIDVIYDDIKLMDYDSKLYAVTLSNRKGVIDFNGNIKINLDYEEIGIDISEFSKNDIRNGYIIAGKLIPVQHDKLWGFYDKSGNKVTECKYDSIGYIANSGKASSRGYSLLVVPDYNVIVVEKDKKYNLVSDKGEEKFSDFFFDSIYMEIENNATKYWMVYNSERIDVVAYLKKLDEMQSKNTDSSLSTSQGNNNKQEENNSQDNSERNEQEENDNNNGNNNDNNDDNGNNESNNNQRDEE